jgi:hypothetical protein
MGFEDFESAELGEGGEIRGLIAETGLNPALPAEYFPDAEVNEIGEEEEEFV